MHVIRGGGYMHVICGEGYMHLKHARWRGESSCMSYEEEGIHACPLRRRIHACHMRHAIGRGGYMHLKHARWRGESSCMSYEEEDTCMSFEEEDTCTWSTLEGGANHSGNRSEIIICMGIYYLPRWRGECSSPARWRWCRSTIIILEYYSIIIL